MEASLEEMKSCVYDLTVTFVTCYLSQLGHAIRLLLEYTETGYEEKRYAMGDGNDILLVTLFPNFCPLVPSSFYLSLCFLALWISFRQTQSLSLPESSKAVQVQLWFSINNPGNEALAPSPPVVM